MRRLFSALVVVMLGCGFVGNVFAEVRHLPRTERSTKVWIDGECYKLQVFTRPNQFIEFSAVDKRENGSVEYYMGPYHKTLYEKSDVKTVALVSCE